MSRFINSNPGLKSRFNHYYYFEDYNPNELLLIFKNLCEQHQFILALETQPVLLEKLKNLYEHRDQSFGNGRLVRNLFEKTYQKMANRLAKYQVKEINSTLMTTILPEDIL